jgi:hypothetical protein
MRGKISTDLTCPKSLKRLPWESQAMKALKIVGVILGGIILLVALVVCLAFVPAVQTWAVRKAVAGQPGLKIDIGRVAVGLSAAEISDLRLDQDGLVVTIKRVSANYSAWEYVKHRRVDVDSVAVNGMVVDTRQMPVSTVASTAPLPSAPVLGEAPPRAPVFLGVLHLARLPLDVRLGNLAVDGRLVLSADRGVDFTLQGGGIEIGKRGQIAWKIDFSDGTKGAALRVLHSNGSIGLRIAADRRIDRIDLENTAAAEGPKLPADQVRTELTAEQAAPDANEVYTTRVALIRDAKTEPVFNSRVEYVASTHKLDGTWDLAVNSEQLAAVLAGLGLPEVSARGSGRFSIEPDRPSAVGSGDLNVGVSGLEKLGPQFASVGPLQMHVTFDGAYADNVARLNQLELSVATADAHKLVEIATAQPVSYNTVTQRLTLAKPDSELARIAVQGIPLAWAQPFVKALSIDSGALSAVLSIAAEADGSRAHLRTIQPVTFDHVTLRDGEKKLVDQASLSLSPSVDYSPAKVTASIPDLKLALPAGDSVNGNISADVTNLAAVPVIVFSAKFQERLVSVHKPFLPYDPGTLTVDSVAEGRLEGQTLQLTKFSSVVDRSGDVLVASVETLQPLTANFATVRVAPANAAAAVARIILGEMPLSTAQAFVPRSKFSGTLNGATFEVTMPAQDRFGVQTATPVSLRGVTVVLDGQTLAKGLDLDLDFSAAKNGQAVSGELRRLEVRQGSAVLAKVVAKGGATLGEKLIASGKGRLEADLAAVMQQPALAASAVLSRGNLVADFEITSGDPLLAKATVTLRNLVARQGNQAMGDLDCSVDASLKADASAGTAKIPLTLAVGDRRSDLSLEGSFTRAAAKVSFKVKLGSNQIVVDDFMALAALAPQGPAASSPAAKPAGGSQPAAKLATNPGGTAAQSTTGKGGTVAAHDTSPFWNGVEGRFDADLKLVKYGPEYTITGIRCAAVVDDKHLALENLEGKFKDNAFKVSAGIAFAPKAPRPYTLTGLVTIPGLDIGAILKAANSNEAPQLETVVAVNGKFGGMGTTAADLMQNATGQFDVTGSKGVLRALGKKGELAGTASKLIGLFGALQGSDNAAALSQLTDRLREMPFDHFAMHAERGADLNLKLTSLEFISPETRLTGSGTIQHQKGVEIANQPLHVELQLAGKDSMALVLGKAYLLGDQQDDKGYTLMSSPFVIGGTPSNPDSSQLWKIIGAAGAKAIVPALPALNGLFH